MAYRPPRPLSGKQALDEFASGAAALDDWLRRHARVSQASGTARVYVATLADGCTVVGYYALAAAQVAPGEAVARARTGQPTARPVPAIVLARLAVDERHQRIGVGRSLLQDVLLRCLDAAKSIGARVLLVHAKSEDAKSFYLRFGFEPSPSDPLNLQLLMKDIRRTVRTTT